MCQKEDIIKRYCVLIDSVGSFKHFGKKKKEDIVGTKSSQGYNLHVTIIQPSTRLACTAGILKIHVYGFGYIKLFLNLQLLFGHYSFSILKMEESHLWQCTLE